MATESQPNNPRSRGIYLLPNLLTTAGLFFGFYAIVAGMNGLYDLAAIAIFIAMIADLLDGRVARLTNTQSAFGAEYDSLSDMISFGIAPTLVIYSWSLTSLGKLGWLVSFLYTAAGALRLARFNTQIGTADKRYFQGLPIPAAAAVVTSFVWVGQVYGMSGNLVGVISGILTLYVAIMMVSNIRYHSFKDFDLRNKVPFFAILIVVLVFVAVSIDPPSILFLLFFSYAISGPLLTLIHLHKRRKKRKPLLLPSDPPDGK